VMVHSPEPDLNQQRASEFVEAETVLSPSCGIHWSSALTLSKPSHLILIMLLLSDSWDVGLQISRLSAQN
jgi:hypothetical protein